MKKFLSGQILIIAVLTAVGKVGAFFRDLLLSYSFGAGVQTDAFFIANSIPGLVFSGVFATIALVFLPIYIRDTNTANGSRKAFINSAFMFYLGIAAGLSLLTIVFAPPITRAIAPEASPETQALAILLTRIMALGFVFTSWVGLQNAIQQAHKSFVWPIAVPVYNHIAVIIGIGVAVLVDGSIIIVVIAAIAGWALQSPLQWMFARKFYDIDRSTFGWPNMTLIHKLIWFSIPVFISVSLDQINIIFDLFLGAAFGEGAVSHLSFAFRLNILIGGVFALPISFLIFPYLSDALKMADITRTRQLLTRGIGIIVVLNTPMMAYTYLQAPAMIELLFQRGEFDPKDTISTATALQMYVFGTLFMGLREILNRVFMADQNMLLLIVFSGVAFVFNVTSSLYLQQTMGLAGIALGTTIGAIVFVVVQIIYMLFKRPGFLSTQLYPIAGITIVSCGVMLTAIAPLHQIINTSVTRQILWDVPILSLLYFGLAGLLAYVYYCVFDVKLWKL